MTIMHVIQGSTIRVGLKGDMDLKTADPLREALDKLIDRYRQKNLVLDLGDVDFVDSSGLGVILGRYRRLRLESRTMSLIGVKPSVRAVLALAGIDSIMGVSEAGRGRPESATFSGSVE